MQYIPQPVYAVLAVVSPETLASFIVTAFFTIINLLVTYWVLKKFLFKPAIKFMHTRQEKIEAEIKAAKETCLVADTRLGDASKQIEKSVREASAIVNDARVQAETQSAELIENAKKEALDIIERADTDVERMRTSMIEGMRNEVADLAVSIASKVIRQTVDEKKQKELVDQFIGEEMKGKV